MKKQIGKKQLIYPLPAVLVATFNEDHSPNAMTAAWCSTCCNEPPSVGVAIHKKRLTYENIQRSGAFSINIPAASQATEVDFIGIVSGKRQHNKLEVARLSTSSATHVDAPLIDSCPICIECKLTKSLPIGSHTWFVGEVMETHVDERAVGDDGALDVDVIDPLVYCTTVKQYRRLGDVVARAFDEGKKLK